MKPHAYSLILNALCVSAKTFGHTQQLRAQLSRTLATHGIIPEHGTRPASLAVSLSWSLVKPPAPPYKLSCIVAHAPLGIAEIFWNTAATDIYLARWNRANIGMASTLTEARELVEQYLQKMAGQMFSFGSEGGQNEGE